MVIFGSTIKTPTRQLVEIFDLALKTFLMKTKESEEQEAAFLSVDQYVGEILPEVGILQLTLLRVEEPMSSHNFLHLHLFHSLMVVVEEVVQVFSVFLVVPVVVVYPTLLQPIHPPTFRPSLLCTPPCLIKTISKHNPTLLLKCIGRGHDW